MQYLLYHNNLVYTVICHDQVCRKLSTGQETQKRVFSFDQSPTEFYQRILEQLTPWNDVYEIRIDY